MMDITEKTKKWINHELEDAATQRGYNSQRAKTRCYGVVMFVTNELLGYDSPEGQELIKWWDNVIHPKFEELY